jgi:hypothetical protein
MGEATDFTVWLAEYAGGLDVIRGAGASGASDGAVVVWSAR